jgi:hypothetical protein
VFVQAKVLFEYALNGNLYERLHGSSNAFDIDGGYDCASS